MVSDRDLILERNFWRSVVELTNEVGRVGSQPQKMSETRGCLGSGGQEVPPQGSAHPLCFSILDPGWSFSSENLIDAAWETLLPLGWESLWVSPTKTVCDNGSGVVQGTCLLCCCCCSVGMWDQSSLIRDQTYTPCIASSES